MFLGPLNNFIVRLFGFGPTKGVFTRDEDPEFFSTDPDPDPTPDPT